MLTFRQIEIFKTVMECGSLSASARQLRIAQPTVSRLVLRMEDQLGISLFIRTKGRLLPTHEATRFLEEIDRAYDAMRTAIERGAQAAKPEQTAFRCGASPSVGRSLVPQAAARLIAMQPDIALQLDILSVNQVIPYLLDGAADIVVSLFPVLHQDIISLPVGQGRPVLIIPRSFSPVAWDTGFHALFNAMHWIIFQPRSVHGDVLASIVADEGLRPVRTHLVRFAETAVAMVEQGIGISIVDEFSARAADLSKVQCILLETRHRYNVHVHRPAANGRIGLFETFRTNLEQAMRDCTHTKNIPCP